MKSKIRMSACGALGGIGWGLCPQNPRDILGQMKKDPENG
jgi:hypothetical protein